MMTMTTVQAEPAVGHSRVIGLSRTEPGRPYERTVSTAFYLLPTVTLRSYTMTSLAVSILSSR